MDFFSLFPDTFAERAQSLIRTVLSGKGLFSDGFSIYINLLTILSLAYLVTYSMAIPVMYHSSIPNATLFHILEAITAFVLVAMFTFMLNRDAMERKHQYVCSDIRRTFNGAFYYRNDPQDIFEKLSRMTKGSQRNPENCVSSVSGSFTGPLLIESGSTTE